MTNKDNLQKELLEKVKPGTKPSHLKKLKRSKSDSDIPKAPPLPLSSEVEPLKKATALNVLLSEQLKEKQSEIEDLRKQLEKTNPNSTESSELDQSLLARHKNLKGWFTQYQKTKKLDQELTENIDEAAQELINQAETISQLRGQVKNLKLTHQSLAKDLELAHRAVEWRKTPLPNNNSYSSTLLTYAFLTLWLLTLLNTSWNNFKAKE